MWPSTPNPPRADVGPLPPRLAPTRARRAPSVREPGTLTTKTCSTARPVRGPRSRPRPPTARGHGFHVPSQLLSGLGRRPLGAPPGKTRRPACSSPPRVGRAQTSSAGLRRPPRRSTLQSLPAPPPVPVGAAHPSSPSAPHPPATAFFSPPTSSPTSPRVRGLLPAGSVDPGTRGDTESDHDALPTPTAETRFGEADPGQSGARGDESLGSRDGDGLAGRRDGSAESRRGRSRRGQAWNQVVPDGRSVAPPARLPALRVPPVRDPAHPKGVRKGSSSWVVTGTGPIDPSTRGGPRSVVPRLAP